mgnify:FL=1
MLSAPQAIFGPNLFRIFVDELGGAKHVAKFLDVSIRSVQSWLANENPPRAVVLALYWESRYGRSLIESDQINEIRLLYRRVQILQEQYAKAQKIVAGLRHLNTGTANDAFYEELPDLSYEAPNTWGLESPLAGIKQKQANGA